MLEFGKINGNTRWDQEYLIAFQVLEWKGMEWYGCDANTRIADKKDDTKRWVKKIRKNNHIQKNLGKERER